MVSKLTVKQNNVSKWITAIMPIVLLGFCIAAQAVEAPTGMMCELLAHPEITVIKDAEPEFTWIMNSSLRGDVQTAYQILVASSQENLAKDLGDVWDSGKVASNNSINVTYQGNTLAPGKTYYWKVRIWNRDDTASTFSAPQQITMADTLYDYATSTYPLAQTEIAPVLIEKKGNGHYLVDFGKDAFGYLNLYIQNAPRKHDLEIQLGEKIKDGAVDSRPGGTIRYAKVQQEIEKGSGTYRVNLKPNERNTSGAAILLPDEIGVVMPFRYVEIKRFRSHLTESMIRQVAVHYPFGESESSFTSSDETLNAVWDLCKYSTKATSFCGIYVDGDRERIPYEADAYINQLLHYGTDREYTMARNSLEYLITHPTWPTEWILDTVLMAWADYLYTGNTESLAHWYDNLKAKTLIALEREDGLISTTTGLVTEEVLKSIHIDRPIKDLVDWPPADFTVDGKYGERDGHVMAEINTVVNAFHYKALTLMAHIAEALGKVDDAKLFKEHAAKVKSAVNEKLFDATSGIYVDGEGVNHSSVHANMMPLALGLVPDEQQEKVANFIQSRGMACSVYGAQFLLDGLYHAERENYALELMTAKHDRSWWNMIAVGSTVTLEAWDWKYKNNLDWNHAWGAAPGNIIPRYVLGVRPLEPGFSRILIKPQPGTLANAKGVVPTIRGPIMVAFKNAPEKSFELNLTIPANITAEVHIPAATAEDITESGTPISKAEGIQFLRMDKDRAVYEVGSGTYKMRSKLI